MPVSAHDTFSNRHHLSGCAPHSQPVIYPYATTRSVQLGLPADLGGGYAINALVGFDEHAQVHRQARRQRVQGEGGSAVLLRSGTPSC